MKILAVDLGKARTGIAICDEDETLASPVCVLESYNTEKLMLSICKKISELRPGMAVVGLPRNMDGTEGESARNARAFAEELALRSGLEVALRDERLTTVSAHGYLDDTGTRGKKRKAVVDAVAATIILQNFLSYRRQNPQTMPAEP